MRCSTCMSTMVAEGTSLICPSCGRIMDAQPLDIPDPGALAKALPKDRSWTRGWGAGLIGLGVTLGLLGLGGTGGWMLHEQAVRSGTTSPVPALLSLLEIQAGVGGEDDMAERLTGIIPVAGESRDGRSLIGRRPDGRLELRSWTPAGNLRAQTPLRLGLDGTLKAAVLIRTGALVTAFRTETRLELLATDRTGQTLWRRGFDLFSTGDGPVHLQPLGDGLVLVYPGEARGRIATAQLNADGVLLWQRSLSGLANAELKVLTSPFDEVVLIHDLSDAPELQLTTLAGSGLPGISTRLDRAASEVPLAVMVDEQGRVHILLTGTPPRLIRVDALGAAEGAGRLVQLEGLTAGTPCLMQGQPDQLSLICSRDTHLQLDRFDVTGTGPALLSRAETPISGVTRLFHLSDTHIIAETSEDGQTGRTLTVLDRPYDEVGPADPPG